MSTLYVTNIGAVSSTDINIEDNIALASDSSEIKFGADKEIKLVHVNDYGLNLKKHGGTAGYPTLTFQSDDTIQSAGEKLGAIHFQAPDASAEGDSILVAAGIEAVAERQFTSTINETYLSFLTGESETATEKMRLTSAGHLGLAADAVEIWFGASKEITLTHEHNTGLILTHTATADNTPIKLTLKSEEDEILDGEVIGAIDFKGGDDSAGDATLVCAGIEAVATAAHAADNNAAKLSFKTAASETAAEKMALSSAGDLSLTTDGASIKFGADSDIILTHDHDSGLTLTQETDAHAEPVLTLKTVGDLAHGPTLHFILDNGAGEDDDDILGTIKFSGDKSNNAEAVFAQIIATSSDVTDNDEGGQLKFHVMAAGTAGAAQLMNLLSIGGEDVANSSACEVTVNDSSIDCNFRVESNINTHAFFLQGSDGSIGIGNPAPGSTLEISKVSGQPSLELSAWSATATAAHAGVLKFQKAGTGAINTFTGGDHTTAGEILGRIEAYGVDDDDGATLSSYIEFANDAVSDADSSPGKIVFATSDADDAGAPTVRLTIDDDGKSSFTGDISTADAKNIIFGNDSDFTLGYNTDYSSPVLDTKASTFWVISSGETTEKPEIYVSNGANDATGPHLTFAKTRGWGGSYDRIVAADDVLGNITWTGADGAGSSDTYAKIQVKSTDIVNGDECGEITFQVANDPSMLSILTLGGRDTQNGPDYPEIKMNTATATATGGGFDAVSPTLHVARVNGEIVTTILVDIGAGSIVDSGTLKDVIGENDVAAAYLTRITTAVNGVIYKAEMSCIEVPDSADDNAAVDIDLVTSSNSLAEDALYDSGTTEVALIPATAAWTVGMTRSSAAGLDCSALSANSHYVYLANGTGANSGGTYNAGKFVIKLYGASF